MALAIAVAFVLVLAGAGASVARADTGDPLAYYGGPVVHAGTGVVVEWGQDVNPIYTDPTTGDPGLINYFHASSGSAGDVGGVLAQYMDRHGNAAPNVSYGGEYPIAPSVTSSPIDDAQIQNELVSQIESGALPQPSGRRGIGTVYLVLFPAGDTECMDTADTQCSGTYFCAYHGDARMPDGTAVLYAVLPDNTAGPMSEYCGGASTPLANQTSYLSHEWSEAITDPLVGEATSANAWPLSWYDNNCGTVNAICGEIGDKCNQEQAVNAGWTVQLEWSNLDMDCEASEPAYSAPTASFTAGTSTYVGQSLGFDASSSTDPSADRASMTYQGTPYSVTSGISSYGWNWGDGTTPDTGETSSHTFAAPGVYQVSMTATDDLGFTSTVTHPVVVWSNSPPVAPDVSTTAAAGTDYQSASLDGSVDPHGQPFIYSFAYGTSPDTLDQSTAPTDAAPGTDPGAQQVSTALAGLRPSTTYYFQLNVDVAGQTSSGDVESFTTSAAPPPPQSGSSSGGNGDTTTTTTAPTPPAGPGAQNPAAPAPAAPRLPSAATGGTVSVTSSSATVAGGVDPDGLQTSYLVEFGKTTAYGHSSIRASAGAAQSNVAVRATLTGLRPRTVYHYRLVAINGAGTAVGSDRTFKTPAAPPPAPRFSFLAPSRITLAHALAGKLRIGFQCSTACTARFAVTLALPGIKRLQAIPVTFARASATTRSAGAGHLTLRLTAAVRSALRTSRSLRLEISGYAVRGSSAPSTPRVAQLTLIR